MVDYILKTERLFLRKLNIEDADFIICLLNSPGWLQFIGDKNVKTKDQAIDYLKNGPIRSYHENGFGLCLVEKSEDHLAVGVCGILKRDSLDQPDLGFAFLPEYQGMGYAYEISMATVGFAFAKLKLPLLYAISKPDNQKSIVLLQRLGFEFVKIIQATKDTEALSLFHMRNNQWRSIPLISLEFPI